MASDNLWPEDLEVGSAVAEADNPSMILRQQASALGERTHNVIEARVQTGTSGDKLVHRFFLFAPLMSYSVPLFQVEHGVDPYPVSVVWTPLGSPKSLASPAEFRQMLEQIFRHETTRRSVSQLLAYSRERELPYILIEDDEVVGEAKTLEEAKKKARSLVDQDSEVVIRREGIVVSYVRFIGDQITVQDVRANGKTRRRTRRK